MSKVIKKNENRSFSSYVETKDGKRYYVDSAWTRDAGYELMVFPVNENFEVTDWGELYAEHYSSYSKMAERHKIVCEKLEEYLSGDAEYEPWNEDDEDDDEEEETKKKVDAAMAEILQKLDALIEKLEKEVAGKP